MSIITSFPIAFLSATVVLTAVTRAPITPRWGEIPMAFEEAPRQVPGSAQFVARGPGYTIALDTSGSTLALRRGEQRIRTRLLGAGAYRMEGESLLPGRVHRVLGGSPTGWQTDIPTFGTVRVRDVYPGIDLIYYGNQKQLEYDFEVAPGADPGRIRMQFSGVREVVLAGNGDLVLQTEVGEIRHRKPYAYQSRNGTIRPVEVRYRISPLREVSFEISEYERSSPLTIDPVLEYSSYGGGAGDDRAYAIAVDASGCAYIAGETYSADFPVASSLQPWLKGYSDVFIMKLNASGTGILFSTYIGGSDRDQASAIALDSSGNIYISGMTRSTDFPSTYGAYRTSNAGGEEAFVAKFDATGGHLAYSTYLGGSGNDRATALALDAARNAYVAGYTSSVNFPLALPGQSAFGGVVDGFVAKLNNAGTALVYSTYIGGSDNDTVTGIAVDSSGGAYFTGQTQSADFPAQNALQPRKKSNGDAFLAKLTPEGNSFAFSTYLGGSGADSAKAIALDAQSNVYIAGTTYSPDFPVTSGAFRTSNSGAYDAFIAKLNPTATTLVYGTYAGGAASEEATAIAVDTSGNVYVAGNSTSTDFPAMGAIQPQFGGTVDAFVLSLDAKGEALRFSTYLGGSEDDRAQGIAVDEAAQVYVAGYTSSPAFPVTTGAFQTAYRGRFDAFVSKISSPRPPSAVSVSPSSGSGGSQTFSFVFSDPNGGADITSANIILNNLETAVDGSHACFLYYDRVSNSVLLAADSGAGFVGGVTPGASQTVENSQCQLSGSGSSAITSGDRLTLSVALVFKPAFAGTKHWFVYAADHGGLTTPGYQVLGSWTVPGLSPPSPPRVTSMAPVSGAGSSQTFTFSFSDPNGYADISSANIILNTAVDGSRACFLYYDRTSNTLLLAGDSGAGFVGGIIPGAPQSVQNSQCQLSGSGSSVVNSGESITLSIAFTFKPAFAGTKKWFVYAADKEGLTTPGYQVLGGWTVPGALAASPPQVTSVTPVSGAGASQTFSFVLSDPNGNEDINSANLILNTSIDGSNACFLYYARASNIILLATDSGLGFVGGVTPGEPKVVQNSQCQLSGSATSAIASGNKITLTVGLVFTSAFAGAKSWFVYVADNGGLTTAGYQALGSWTATGI